MTEMLERFQGCLVGLAVGDALGGPLEGLSPGQIEARYGGPVRDMVGGGWLDLRPGECTDDTYTMLCIAESIVARREFDMDDVAARFLAWYESGPKDIGNITRIALEELRRGAPWREAGMIANQRLQGRSAGNGSIMRCAPIGLFRFRDYRRLIQDSIDSSCFTHWDARAGYSAAAVNLAIAELVQGRREGMEKTVLFYLEKGDSRVRHALERLNKVKDKKALHPTSYVIDTFQAAFWCFLSTDTFEEALVTAVNLGEDADTVGAVCGALAGAWYGLENIPSRWLRKLENRARILSLAEDIYRLATAQ